MMNHRQSYCLMILVGWLIWPNWALGQPLNQLQGVDFQLGLQQQAQILVTLSERNVVVDAKKNAKGLRVSLLDTHVADEQLQLLDVSDFASIVNRIDVSRTPSGARLDIHTTGDFIFQHTQVGNVLQLTLQALEPASPVHPLFSNAQRMSLNFQDIELRRALQLVADYNDFNLLVADDVTGRLTLRLDDVPWPQVLDLILQVKGLQKHIQGNVVLITTRNGSPLTSEHSLPMDTLVLHLNYANVSDIADVLSGHQRQAAPFAVNDEGIPLPFMSKPSSLLSAQGSFSVDSRTNTLIVRDTSSHLNAVSEMVKALDVPVKQVQIEARIVSLNEGSLEELGVRWGLNSHHGDVRMAGSIEQNYDSSDINLDQVLNVNLAATAANTSSIAFQIANLGTNTLLDLELSALQSESKAEIISSPSLLTTNKQPAYIEQGTEIPYVESASSGATSVAFKKAVLSLKVTPQITPNNRLVLDLSVTQDRPGEVVKTGTGEAVAIHTQRIGTQVLVNSGETVVLGGIYQQSFSDTLDKVPLLGDLPIVGSLFRRSYQKMGKSELLIFVTPKVVTQ